MPATRQSNVDRTMPLQLTVELPRGTNSLLALTGVVLCAFVASAFAVISPACAHWFIVPVTLCGILLVPDVRDWIVGRLDIFDPAGIIAVIGVHVFFLAPILHVYWDYWMDFVVPPPDWRPWLGYMGVINIIGLLVYMVARRIGSEYLSQSRPRPWSLDQRRFGVVCGVSCLSSLVLQFLAYQRFGGIRGYAEAFEDGSDQFQGMGWIFMVSESFPILALMAYAVAAKRKPMLRGWAPITVVLIAIALLQLLFGGLRGSRSNTVWSLFWASGIVHFWIRPLKRSFVVFAIIALLGFNYAYGLYKSYGLTALNVIAHPEQHSEMAAKCGRTFRAALLEDFGRSDVQAYMVYQLCEDNKTYTYKWGQTYLNAILLPIPAAFRPGLVGKREAGTELQYGYYDGEWSTSRIYGLAGEAMLNFGPFSGVIPFALFGLVMARFRGFLKGISRTDPRWFIIPCLVNAMFVGLVSDLDNVIWHLVKLGAVPFAVIVISSRLAPRAAAKHGTGCFAAGSDIVLRGEIQPAAAERVARDTQVVKCV